MDKKQIIVAVEILAGLVAGLAILVLIKTSLVACGFLLLAGVVGGVAEYLRRKE